MDKRSRRKVGARRYVDYSQEILSVAVDLVNSKSLSSYEAEKKFGIPRRTILNKCKNKHNRAIGRPIELSAEEEKHIADVVEIAAYYGSPLSILDLRLVVYNYLQKCGKTELFGGRMPGVRWARNFLDRHNFTQRATQNIKRSRASKTTEEMSDFYQNLELSLKDVPCENILNFDETNLSDDPGSTKAIFKRGTKHPERVLNSSKSSISIMFSATADGQCLPPYIVYKADHLWSRWCELGPPNARYNRTKSGWFDMACFDDWFKTIILPWASSRGGAKVVIGDNLASHLSVEVVKLCEENNIRLVFLPPNATHLTQPLDVAFFGPMKRCWREILLKYKLTHQNSTTINKCDFPQLLQELMSKINMKQSSNICSGFAGSGIFPFNPSRVLTKIPVVATEESKKFDVCLLEYLQRIRTTTSQSKAGSNKKLAVAAGKSISTEEAEKIKKSKGKGKITKKYHLNSDQELQQPKSLKELSTIIVNKFAFYEDKTGNSNLINMARKKTTKKPTLTSNVRSLSKISKTDDENLPFLAVCKDDLPRCLQTKRSTESGTLLKSAKQAQIKVLSNVLVKAGSSKVAVRKRDLSKNLQTKKAIDSNSGNLSMFVKQSQVLQTILIPKNPENVKSKIAKKQKYKAKKPSRYSSSTTSVSDNMSEHTDSSIISIEPESDTENSPLYCFKQSRPPSACNYTSCPDTLTLNDLDDHMSYDLFSDIACQAFSPTKRSRNASRCRGNVLSPLISQQMEITTSDNTYLGESNMSCNQSGLDFSHDQSKVSTQAESFPKLNILNNSRAASIIPISDLSQPVKNSDSQGLSPVFEVSNFNITNDNDAVLSEKIPSSQNSDSEQTAYDYSVADKVLVRYYARNKTWKNYIGVVTACNVDQTFDISFYTMTRNKGEIKFKKPKKIDRDTVPKALIVKVIEIDKISDKPEQYKLHDPEDAIYF